MERQNQDNPKKEQFCCGGHKQLPESQLVNRVHRRYSSSINKVTAFCVFQHSMKDTECKVMATLSEEVKEEHCKNVQPLMVWTFWPNSQKQSEGEDGKVQ